MAKRMTVKEREDWDTLYMYVKCNVLGYDASMKIPNYLALRLKGLAEGKFMVNDLSKEMANYSYELILNTFKICNPEIQRGLRNIEFNDESHKINYIMSVIDSNINDVYMRAKKVKETKEDVLRQVEMEADTAHEIERPKYKREKKKKDRFAEFW